MTALSGSIQLRSKTAAQWAAYATPPLSRQPCVESDTGQLKIGDGTSLFSALPYVGDVSTSSRVISGGTVSVASDDATIAAATYFIEGEGTFSSPLTNFNNITLSSSGTQRFVAFYGNTSSTVTKVEGAESALAVMPSTPADTVLLGYILVTDAVVSETPDLSGYLLRADKATASEVITATNDEKYVTPLSLAAKKSFTHRFHGAALALVDGVTYFYSGTNNATPTTSTLRYVRAAITATLADFSVALYNIGSVGSNETLTVRLKNVTSGQTVDLTTTLTVNANSQSAVGTVSFSCTKGDLLEVHLVVPTLTTNPNSVAFHAEIGLKS